MIGSIRRALKRTRDRIRGVLKKGILYEEIERFLILSDVGYDLSEEIVEMAKKRGGDPVGSVKEVILEILKKDVKYDDSPPYTVVVVGVNGSGKTTTVAKLAYRFKMEGRRVLIGAADTYRDAGTLQIERWAEMYGLDIVRAERGQDPGAVAYDTLSRAKAKGYDTVVIDTAGRLHTRGDLMRQVKKIVYAASKSKGGDVNEILLTLDATSGQNAIVQAETFYRDVGVNGVVVTKLDGTARGGFIISVVKNLDLPVRYVGVGEGIEDIVDFVPEEFVEALFEVQ